MKVSRNKAWLFGPALTVFVAALALRGLPVLWHQMDESRLTTVDSGRYLELADRLAAGDGFRLPVAAPETRAGSSASWPNPSDPGARPRRLGQAPGLEPELFRTPGYPLVLALAGSLPGSRHACVLGLQILAGAATATLCFVLISNWASRRAGLLAAALLALDPAHILYSNLLMSDVLCGASIAASLVLLEPVRGSSWRLGAAGGFLTAATALRPVAVLLVIPAAVYLWRRGDAWRGVAVLVAAALLFPVGWTARNGLAAGSWTLSTAFDVNLALVAGSRTEARAGDLPRGEAEAVVMGRVAATESATGMAFHRACRVVALDTLRGEPGAAMIELPVAAAEMLLAGERRYLMQMLGLPASEGREGWPATARWPGLRSYSRFERLVVAGQAGFMAAVWILAATGIVVLWRRGRADLALFALFALAVVLIPSLVVGTGRMRLPVAVLFHGLAGIGGVAAVSREFRRPAAG